MQKYFAFIKKFLDFFRRHGDDDRSLMDKLRDKYRLVVMNDETFEEVTSLKLSPLSVYVFLSSLVVGTAIVVTLLIVYTPLKRYIPGYGDYNRDQEIAELTTKVGSLEEEIEAHRRYNENFRKILVGDLADMGKDAAEKQVTPANPNDSLPEDVDRIPEDDQLRAAVAKGTFSSDPAANTPVVPAMLGARELPLEQMSFMPPVSGEATSSFDLSKKHFGIDIAAPKNTAVKAAADGVVISSGYAVETGYSIAIQHPNNVVTMYKHNSVLLKPAGAAVKAGEAIAMIGNTGVESSGPHLHFELWYRGRAVDPSDYINF
ncbi:MAG: M23 family metallopeptidase [Saprospiraceae bacterium]|nr:M23 family metallopeptidase [Saprospiraceae bacterium]MCC7504128.1 M23 family metallopeptidase [Saprospiraceae bacterium]